MWFVDAAAGAATGDGGDGDGGVCTLYTVSQKTSTFYFSNSSLKN